MKPTNDLSTRVYRHKFRGKVYCFRPWAKGMKVCGLCDPPDMKNKTIRIAARMAGVERLEAVIHESLHACFWDMSEGATKETAESIALLLWKMGYRCGDEVMEEMRGLCKQRGIDWKKINGKIDEIEAIAK